MTNPKKSLTIDPKALEDLRVFVDSGLLWLVNRTLHLYGYALTCTEDEDGNIVAPLRPMRVVYRGFHIEDENDGYERVARYLKEHADELYAEPEYPPSN